MLHKKFYLNIVAKSQLQNPHSIFFQKVTGDFIVAKSGIKNNSLQAIVITKNGTLPENGEYSDGFIGAKTSEGILNNLYEYAGLLNTNANIKVDLLDAVINGKESMFVDFIATGDRTFIEEAKSSVEEVQNIVKEVISEKSNPKVKKEPVAIGTIQPLSDLEKSVLVKCFAEAGSHHTGFSFRVCEGNLSLAGAFSTLQRKGYIETFFDKIDKRKEKFYTIIRNEDGKLL